MTNELEYEDVEVIMMPMDDGSEQECTILDEFDLDGRSYMILSPSVDGVCGGEIQYYSVEEDGEDLMMDSVEDEAELEKIREAFRKHMER